MAYGKKIGDITVNDSKGLYDNEGLIDTLIVDCNESIKLAMSGQYIAWCNLHVQMVKKLANLKNGVIQDKKSLQEQIDNLKAYIQDITPDKVYEQNKQGGDVQ